MSKCFTRRGKAMSADMLVEGSPGIMGFEVGTGTLVVILARHAFGGFSRLLFSTYVLGGCTNRRNMPLSVCSSNSVDFFDLCIIFNFTLFHPA